MGIRVISASVLSIALSSVPAAAETAPAQSKARILRPITFAILLEMDFGQVIVGSSGGTVLLNPVDGSRDCSSGGLSCTGGHSVARLNLSGSDAIVSVTYDPSFVLTGPGAPMTVNPLFVGGSGSQITMTGGSATVEFGAALTVNANQLDGNYTGDFSVNVNYN